MEHRPLIITEQDVREYMRDRTYEDNLILPDVAYTSSDIQFAMRSAAREFNGLTPLCMTVHPDFLPGETNVFLDGIAAALIRTSLTNASANELDYSAGGVTANVQGKLVENNTRMEKLYSERFRTTAKGMKISANYAAAYGQVG